MIAGLSIVAFDYLSSASWEVLFLLVGAWSVTTSVFGLCPFYGMVGLSTCKLEYTNDPPTEVTGES